MDEQANGIFPELVAQDPFRLYAVLVEGHAILAHIDQVARYVITGRIYRDDPILKGRVPVIGQGRAVRLVRYPFEPVLLDAGTC